MELGMGEGLSSLYGRQRFKAPPIVNLVGCGGGAWVAIFAAMSGTERLRLFDGDVVELSNLNRLPYSQEAVGKKKTTALREFIQNLRPDCSIEEYPAITDTLQISLLDKGYVVLAIDSLKARKMIDEAFRLARVDINRSSMRCLHVNFEADKYKVSWGLWEEELKAIEIDTGYENPNEQYVSTAVAASAHAVAMLINIWESQRMGRLLDLTPKRLVKDEQEKKSQKESKS